MVKIIQYKNGCGFFEHCGHMCFFYLDSSSDKAAVYIMDNLEDQNLHYVTWFFESKSDIQPGKEVSEVVLKEIEKALDDPDLEYTDSLHGVD